MAAPALPDHAALAQLARRRAQGADPTATRLSPERHHSRAASASAPKFVHERDEQRLPTDPRLFVLDGAVQYNKQDDTGRSPPSVDPDFQRPVLPGDHTLQVLFRCEATVTASVLRLPPRRNRATRSR
jgi:hypothetical protein